MGSKLTYELMNEPLTDKEREQEICNTYLSFPNIETAEKALKSRVGHYKRSMRTSRFIVSVCRLCKGAHIHPKLDARTPYKRREKHPRTIMGFRI